MAAAGMSGNNKPCVAYSFDSLASNSMKSKNPNSGCRAVEVAKTLDTTDPNPCKNQGGIAIVEPIPYTLKIRSGCEGGGKGALVQEDKSATLATNNDQYLFQPMVDAHILDDQGGSQISVRTDGKCPTLPAEMHGNIPAVMEPKAYGVDCRNATEYPEMTGALQADAAHNLNSNNTVRVQYIVRRLTPTECARLQGFPDRWGDIDEKDSFTPEEFRFWHEVRNTHARINGKKVQEYTEAQMLTWYNKLHTDSAEYKMWGNGIALPPALYCMQGIVDAMGKGEGL